MDADFDKNKKVQSFIEDFLNKMSISFDRVDMTEDIFGQKRFVIQTDEHNLLIGPKGEGVSALNHLIKRILFRDENEGGMKFSIDINNYQETIVQNIVNKAKILSERVKFFKTNVEMEPMTSYERMIVHTLFQDDPDIKTESQGFGNSRRIIIKYEKKEN